MECYLNSNERIPIEIIDVYWLWTIKNQEVRRWIAHVLKKVAIVGEGGKNLLAIFVLMKNNNVTLEESQYNLTINKITVSLTRNP